MRGGNGDTFGDLVRDFKASPEFKARSEGTQQLWASLLDASVIDLGELPPEQVTPKIVRDYINTFPEWPGKQRNTLTALRQLETWAEFEGRSHHYMTKGIKFAKLKGGHVPWSMEQVLLAEKHCREDLGRAIVLQALTGQRGSDIVRMCWNDITESEGERWIQVRQKKTGKELGCFILPELEERLSTWPRQPGPILRSAVTGKPFPDRHALSDLWIDELKRNPEIKDLKGLHLHGLRGHYCVRLYRGGMTTRDVAQTVGMSLQMVEHYCKLSDQKKNVSAAILRFKDFQSSNPLISKGPTISMK